MLVLQALTAPLPHPHFYMDAEAPDSSPGACAGNTFQLSRLCSPKDHLSNVKTGSFLPRVVWGAPDLPMLT